MVEFRSALASRLPADAQHVPPGTGVTLGESRIAALGQIAGWESFEAAAAPALSQLGLSGLGDFHRVQTGQDCVAYRTAPDRIVIRHSDPRILNAALTEVNSNIATVLDQSHSRSCFTLKGPATEDLLSRVATLDFHPRAFPPGSFAQTGIHHVAVLIHRLADEYFDILVPVTWAASTFDYLRNNAQSSGFHVGGET